MVATHGKFRGVRVDGFRPEYLDFERGIRVGHLEPHERITQILKHNLQAAYQQPFVTDRWGRGVYWQWICFVPKADRLAKPLSHGYNFGCAKFFLMIDRDEALFKCGMQVERGRLAASGQGTPVLNDDWDWHRLVAGLREGGLWPELRRLVQGEGFCLHAGSWDAPRYFGRRDLSRRELLRALTEAPSEHWSGFQIFYPMSREEVRASSGGDLVDAMIAVFHEVTPAMNACMDIQLSLSDRTDP